MIRERNRELGVISIAFGLISLILLRWWTSPLLRRIAGRTDISVFEFVLIPVFLVPVGIGVILLLWEPEPR